MDARWEKIRPLLPKRPPRPQGVGRDFMDAAQRGIERIAPHRRNRRKPATQDGQTLRSYQRRCTAERTMAWLGNFRRLAVRYKGLLEIFRASPHVTCLL